MGKVSVMSTSQPRRVAIVSSAQTQLRPAWDELQHVDLIAKVVGEALRGSGLQIADVDFVADCGSDVLDGRSISNCGFLGAMGAHHKEESRVEEDGLWGVMYGADKVAGGAAEVALVLAYSKPSESSLSAYSSALTEPFYQRPVGLDHLSAHGLLASMYLHTSGATEADLDRVAAHAWAGAGRNDTVATDEVPDAAAIAASGYAATPLRERHLSRPVDGAVAMLLVSEQVARRVTSTPVWITGRGTAMDSQMITEREPGAFPAARAAAQAAYRRAGLSDPKQVGLAEVSAGSAAAELMVLEALGLAPRGQGITAYDSGPAINPSGGALPADPVMATGLVRLSEAALQLAGRVDRGCPGATSALVHGSGGLGQQNHCVMTLEV